MVARSTAGHQPGSAALLDLEQPLHTLTPVGWLSQTVLFPLFSSQNLPSYLHLSLYQCSMSGLQWIPHISPLLPSVSTSEQQQKTLWAAQPAMVGPGGFSPRVSRVAGGARVPSTVPFEFPIILGFVSRVCKMTGIVIELHVEKSKQAQGCIAGPEFNQSRVYKYSVETRCTLCSEKLMQKLNIQRCSWLPSWEGQCHSVV